MAAPQVYTWVVEAGGVLIGTFASATLAGAYIIANISNLYQPTIRPVFAAIATTVPR